MNKKIIYAKTLNPEDFDYRIYDIREDEGNEVIIDGGRDYCNVDNKGYIPQLKKLITEYDYYYDDYYNEKIMDFLNDMLPKKENGKRISPKEASIIDEVLRQGEEADKISICLSIITGKKYHHKGLCGCCQGDYVDAYYPKDTSKEYIDFVEAWFFGTGTEVIIHDCDNIPQDADDIEGFSFYTATWGVDNLKQAIKRECGYKEENKDVEVKLWLYKDSYRIRHDIYEEAE